MKNFCAEFENFNDAYRPLITHCLDHGEAFAPRGFDCVELRPYCFSLRNPGHSLCRLVNRRLNYHFFVVEALGYITGRGDSEWTSLMIDANSNIGRFVNPETNQFDGAYGPRLQKSLKSIVALLARDPDSRQAVASIWSPGIPESKLDVPCTLSMSFYKETSNELHPKLAMTVHMRSNDLNWGTPYDVAAFATIQLLVASALGWQLGTYTHFTDSLHVYRDQLPEVGFGKYSTMEIPYFRIEDLDIVTTDQPQVRYERYVMHLEDILNEIVEQRADGKKWSEINLTSHQDEFVQKLEKIIRFKHSTV